MSVRVITTARVTFSISQDAARDLGRGSFFLSVENADDNTSVRFAENS